MHAAGNVPIGAYQLKPKLDGLLLDSSDKVQLAGIRMISKAELKESASLIRAVLSKRPRHRMSRTNTGGATGESIEFEGEACGHRGRTSVGILPGVGDGPGEGLHAGVVVAPYVAAFPQVPEELVASLDRRREVLVIGPVVLVIVGRNGVQLASMILAGMLEAVPIPAVVGPGGRGQGQPREGNDGEAAEILAQVRLPGSVGKDVVEPVVGGRARRVPEPRERSSVFSSVGALRPGGGATSTAKRGRGQDKISGPRGGPRQGRAAIRPEPFPM